jgi:hypothetical protein
MKKKQMKHILLRGTISCGVHFSGKGGEGNTESPTVSHHSSKIEKLSIRRSFHLSWRREEPKSYKVQTIKIASPILNFLQWIAYATVPSLFV